MKVRHSLLLFHMYSNSHSNRRRTKVGLLARGGAHSRARILASPLRCLVSKVLSAAVSDKIACVDGKNSAPAAAVSIARKAHSRGSDRRPASSTSVGTRRCDARPCAARESASAVGPSEKASAFVSAAPPGPALRGSSDAPRARATTSRFASGSSRGARAAAAPAEARESRVPIDAPAEVRERFFIV